MIIINSFYYLVSKIAIIFLLYFVFFNHNFIFFKEIDNPRLFLIIQQILIFFNNKLDPLTLSLILLLLYENY